MILPSEKQKDAEAWMLFGTVSNMVPRVQKITNNSIELFSCKEIKFEYYDGYMCKQVSTIKVQDLLDAYNGSWAAPYHYKRFRVMRMNSDQEIDIIMVGSGQSNEFNTHNIVLDGGGTISKNPATDPAPQDPSCRVYVR